MTDTELVAKCKTSLNIQWSTTDFDDVLLQKVGAVKSFMTSAGVSTEVLDDDAAVGAIVMGVADIWTNEPGKVKFSPTFYTLVTQLAATSSILEVAAVPAEGATGVAVGVAPTLTFTRRMKTYTVSLVEYVSQDGVTIDAELDVTGKVLTLTPTVDLDADTRYAIVIGAAKAYSGQSLDYTVISFTTAA